MKEGVSTERKKCEYLSLCLSAPLFLPHGNAIINRWNTPLTGHFFFFTSIFCSHQDPIWPMMEFFMTCQIWTFHDTLSQWGQRERSSSFSDAQPPPAGGSTDILITHSSASGLLLPPQRSYSAVWQVKTQVLLNLQGLVFFYTFLQWIWSLLGQFVCRQSTWEETRSRRD